MLKYDSLSQEVTQRIESDRANGIISEFAFSDDKVIRRNSERDRATIIRTAFIRDIDKIIHCPYYNRYTDKTQVFSFYKNDDITRRALHVQLVSRIARTLGKALGLNQELIEAIALGHDIGHTPFGHAGEEYLDELLSESTGRHFSHNIHSVRVLDSIFPYNISLQTLSGIAAHDGEMELSEYRPQSLEGFDEFDRQIELCYEDKANVRKLVPWTLEGCVVRISDIIAYLGKDRQDAERAKIAQDEVFFGGKLGKTNAEIINNLCVNIIENSYGKPYIKMDKDIFDGLRQAKSENYTYIYKEETVRDKLENTVKPMMSQLYERLLDDLVSDNRSSAIFTHHMDFLEKVHYERKIAYDKTPPEQIVVDYIASMTDDYFVDLYTYLFPDSKIKIEYTGYFD
ncbi:MAG: HD domain-containing protein [Clostridia bacterium]|nr:HD domain-containing protein [Clostridia bacterium]